MATKNSLKDKLEDGELDLSMMQLTDVPVKEIEQLGGKVVSINLSHNLLTAIPANFPLQLGHVTKLDLSKNQLTELPENFGQFRNLKSLDLYANKLEKLPVTFAQLRNLKWLDLKDNPLCPALRQAAGDCITPNDCALCAKKVVALLQSYETQLVRERQRHLEEEMAARKEKERLEELEREKLRQEKRAAKERRREEARQREAETRRETDLKIRHEMQVNGNGSSKNPTKTFTTAKNGYGRTSEESEGSRSCLASLLMFLAGLAVAGLGLAISLLWIYTEGKLDSKTVSAALPVIHADVEEYLMSVGVQTVKWYQEAEKISKPYVTSAMASGKAAWNEGGRQLRNGAKYVEENHGDLLQNIAKHITGAVSLMREYFLQAWREVLPYLNQAWQSSKPYFQQLGKIIIERSLEFSKYLQENFPVYMEIISQALADLVQFTTKTWQKITDAF